MANNNELPKVGENQKDKKTEIPEKKFDFMKIADNPDSAEAKDFLDKMKKLKGLLSKSKEDKKIFSERLGISNPEGLLTSLIDILVDRNKISRGIKVARNISSILKLVGRQKEVISLLQEKGVIEEAAEAA